MKTLLMLCLVLSVLASYTSQAVSNAAAQKYVQVENIIDRLALPDGPGIQYVIVDKDKVVFERSSGLADIKSRKPLSLNHAMAAFSMTKTLTAIAILQLLEKKRINADDKAATYIEHPYNQEITIRHLLNHTSGIPNPIPLKWVHLADEHGEFDEAKALSIVLKKYSKSDTAPGESYAYSNIGYWLLGNVIESVTKQDYQTYVKQRIFQPLKLEPNEIAFEINTTFNHAKGYLAKYSFMNLIKGFITDDDLWGEYEGNWLHVRNVYLNGPAFGGAVGSAKAFSRILQDIMSEKSILLGINARNLLYSEQKNNSGKYINMTLGWHIGELNGGKYFYKEGGGAGFHCEMRVYPSYSLASVIMTNRTSFNSRKELSNIDRHFLYKQ